MILDTVISAVGTYRNHKVLTLNDTPEYLKPYVSQYFDKADKHFERLMDICINIPEAFTSEVIDGSIIINQDKVEYILELGIELSDKAMTESEFVLELFKRTRLCV